MLAIEQKQDETLVGMMREHPVVVGFQSTSEGRLAVDQSIFFNVHLRYYCDLSVILVDPRLSTVFLFG